MRMTGRPTRRTWLMRIGTGVVVALALVELTSFVAVYALAWIKQDLFYVADAVTREEYQRYLEQRDPVRGWPRAQPPTDGSRDAVGSRPVPAYPDPAAEPALVSLYGDSMTESLEVGDQDAWGNQLARLLGGRVHNFGVAGYGTDQAYLRFVGNERDEAPVVLLNHFTDNILRNVNQWRYLISTSQRNRVSFKPRFVADGDQLVAVPLPSLDYDAYTACTAAPGPGYLPHEFFFPDDGVSGVQTMRAPYTLTLLRLFDNFILGSRLRGAPRHGPLYESGHPSDALRVTRLILRDFVAAARARGKTPVVTIIPDGKDLLYFREHGAWPYRPLIDELRTRDGIEVLDFGPGLIERLGERSPCEVVNECYNHFNAQGYRMLAEIAYAHLRERGLAPAAAAATPGS